MAGGILSTQLQLAHPPSLLCPMLVIYSAMPTLQTSLLLSLAHCVAEFVCNVGDRNRQRMAETAAGDWVLQRESVAQSRELVARSLWQLSHK